jgi:hypothetical protein
VKRLHNRSVGVVLLRKSSRCGEERRLTIICSCFVGLETMIHRAEEWAIEDAHEKASFVPMK